MHLFRSILLSVLTTSLCGQAEYFTPYHMEPPQQVSLDTMGIYDDGLVDSTGRLKLYRKGMELWLIEDGVPDVIGWRMREMDNIMKLEYHDFSGGRPELIVTWQARSGNSGWRGGVAEEHEEVLIYDLQHELVLLQLDTYMSVETWWQELDEEAMDSLGTDSLVVIDSGGDQLCEEYSLSVNDSLVIIVPEYDQRCEGVKWEEAGEKLRLVWREDAFYRKD